jgi:general stress protein CsbA
MKQAIAMLTLNILILAGLIFSAAWVPQMWVSLILIVAVVVAGWLLGYTAEMLSDEIWWARKMRGDE